MEVHYCDLCGSVLSGYKHALAIERIPVETSDNNSKTPEDVFRHMQNQQRRAEKVKIYEICDKCKLVWDYLKSKRKQEVKKLQRKAEKELKKKVDKIKDKGVE